MHLNNLKGRNPRRSRQTFMYVTEEHLGVFFLVLVLQQKAFEGWKKKR